MSEFSLPKTYDFRGVEQRLYDWWESQGYFRPAARRRAQAVRHLDAAAQRDRRAAPGPRHVRRRRRPDDPLPAHEGRAALWVPGSDHAGIATQLQVEKHCSGPRRSPREEIGREEFVRRTWEWKEQVRRASSPSSSAGWAPPATGSASASRWTRVCRVPCARPSCACTSKGLIYRGTYLINWSPGLKTAVSDLEVEYSEEQGTLYYFKYPIAGSRRVHPGGDDAPGDHPGRHRRGRAPGRRALPASDRQDLPGADPQPHDPGDP